MLASVESVFIHSQVPVSKFPRATPSSDIAVQDKPVKEVVAEIVSSKLSQTGDADQENSFYVCDIGDIFRQYLRWKSLLPRIEPFFAFKSNPDPMVLKLLAAVGIGFDCASKNEIQTILDLGVDPTRIIYAHTCKQASFIRYAAQKNVAKMTFDNAEELQKIKKYYPNAELLLRILTDDSKAVAQLGLKFGAPLDTVPHLLETAKQLDLNVVGVSFHIGSASSDEYAHIDAIQRARWTFDQGEKIGFNFTLLDVGGGFSGGNLKEGPMFEKVASILGSAVDAHFPPEVRVIAEPGRFFVDSAFTLCANVIGRRTVTNADNKLHYMYYLNDGVYGAFSSITFKRHFSGPAILFKDSKFFIGEQVEEEGYECSIWGPTCDSKDCLYKSIKLPLLEPGDWLYFENMGAYTSCISCPFNGFEKAKVFYTNTFSLVNYLNMCLVY